ncbi:nucleotidyltransferase domain-containing protein [Roseofilum sp. BLCC_M154]|uniref:Nucleotidyltransferase domain-containing protein n=1 Tax=Roseofilum acuticapitatum BLCC-M154 TaxID=3022444 RepID=A0ABT7AMR3_9CYAN|nr:nucleotidyltransferase domain-containing protein [Roseofilum acuticapitatum]MDJ1168182.1 nucleotidyltransferase domain-containing protein [Roseofilum acuticapitatum BLCC-M154]
MLLEERRILVEIATQKLKEYLKQLYQDNLDKVILFGSEARGEAEIDSDVDILIVLKQPFIYFDEIKRVSEFISDLCLDYQLYLSCCFATSQTWQKSETGFYRNLRAEGIEL